LIFLAFYAAGRTLVQPSPLAPLPNGEYTWERGTRAPGGTGIAVPTGTVGMMGFSGRGAAVCNGIDDLNCADFADAAAAQAHLEACGDEDRLDGDGDGRACEGR
jgi:hypothetical protein